MLNFGEKYVYIPEVKMMPVKRTPKTAISDVPTKRQLEKIAAEQAERLPVGAFGKPGIREMNMRKKNLMRQRRRKVALYYIQGMSVDDMADKLGVTDNTIRKDLLALEEQGLQDMDLYKTKKVFLHYTMTIRQVIQELWLVYYDLRTAPSVKVSALKEIAEQRKREVEMMQDLGLLWKEPQKIELSTGELVTEMTDDEIKQAIKDELKVLQALAQPVEVTEDD
jgi:transposase